MRQWLVPVLVACVGFGCKTTQSASAVDQAGQGDHGIQCNMGSAFGGVCQVIDVSGRLDTTTDAARTSRIGDIKALRFAVPSSNLTDQAKIIADSRSKGSEPLWTIDEALDLYNRRSCIAQVSGGIFGEAYAPKLTIRTLFNVHDSSQTGFAEISDYSASKAEHATVTIKCDWQK